MLRENGLEDISWGGPQAIAPFESLRFAERNVHIVGLDCRGRDMSVEQGRLRAYSVEGFTLLYASATDPHLHLHVEVRDQEAIARDGRDRYGLMMQLSGGRRLSQLGRDQRLSPGSLAFFSTSEPYLFENEESDAALEMFTLFMPSAFVERRMGDGRSRCLRGGTTHLDKLARSALRIFATEAWSYSRAEFYRSARAVAELTMLTLGAPDDGGERGFTRTANLNRVKRIVAKRLADPDLTLEQIANEAGLSLNYIHKLFREEEQSFWQYLKTERLAKARDMLRHSALSGRSVTEIAFSCGFSDSSYFSRAFRSAFGICPRQARYPGTA